MTDYQNSQTLKNLQTALAGESLARNKYTFFAAVARLEGHEDIAARFEGFAENEKQHAKFWLSELRGIGNTTANLQQALEAEILEAEKMYPEFAETAEAEGFDGTAKLFRKVAAIEERHAEYFRETLHKLQGAPPPAKKPLPALGKRFLLCKFCGSLEVAEKGDACPLCKNPDAF